jgi:hypothetical protein
VRGILSTTVAHPRKGHGAPPYAPVLWSSPELSMAWRAGLFLAVEQVT